MAGLSLRLGLGLSSPSMGVGVFNDFRQQMPAGSAYTRTGAATGLTLAGLIQSFAANLPPRTDRGLVLGPAATNFIPNSNVPAALTGITVTANAAASPDGTTNACRIAKTDATTPRYATITTSMTVLANTSYSVDTLYKYDGFNTTVSLEYNSGSDWGSTSWVAGFNVTSGGITANTPSNCTSSVINLGGGWYWLRATFTTGATVTTPANPFILMRETGASGVSVLNAYSKIEAGSFSTAPIITTGATATRGLPVFTETVPSGRTKALLTYADASTTLVTGLTPGGTFDVATAVIGAGKGRFGSSELITREWQA